ncbi:putative serine/threonine protein phosphatase [Globomyces sp. JEL0801]|nr:putative serine/threonine protein phosphatase [Globomyces sp. JEL0801]
MFNETDICKSLLLPSQIKELCERVKELLIQEGNVPQVKTPVTVPVVGDIHGQFYDLLEIFKIGGYCPDANYIFLGDYVDRGAYSVEVITLLICLKLRYPTRVTLVRGFYSECMRKFDGPAVWTYFTDLFDYLVLAVVIDNTILCVHGGILLHCNLFKGLSPSIHTIDQIKAIDRFKGPMADLVWSDPIAYDTSTDCPENYFNVSSRGAGYVFGKAVTKMFLEMNQLGHICRAHQICMEGYQIMFDDMLSTVWSAPNYCYRAGNLASILEISPSLERYFNVFDACPDNERDFKPKQHTRLSLLWDEDGSVEKKKKILGARKGHAHSLEEYEASIPEFSGVNFCLFTVDY